MHILSVGRPWATPWRDVGEAEPPFGAEQTESDEKVIAGRCNPGPVACFKLFSVGRDTFDSADYLLEFEFPGDEPAGVEESKPWKP